ncbi:MAG: DUF1439 domain-containing protein [Marinobacter sp.]|nr:DUF1439 domain-containing protein [Marinobacter sp.]
MKRLLALPLAALFLLSACANFTTHTVSEGTIERYLMNAVAGFDPAEATGLPLNVALKTAKVTLGPDGRQVAVLDVRGQVAVDALFARLPVDVALKLEGSPVYDSTEKAVFIRQLKMLEGSIDTPLYRGDLAPVTNSVLEVVSYLLDNTPVYRLDETDARQRMLGMIPMDVRVAPGRLEFVPRD